MTPKSKGIIICALSAMGMAPALTILTLNAGYIGIGTFAISAAATIMLLEGANHISQGKSLIESRTAQPAAEEEPEPEIIDAEDVWTDDSQRAFEPESNKDALVEGDKSEENIREDVEHIEERQAQVGGQ